MTDPDPLAAAETEYRAGRLAGEADWLAARMLHYRGEVERLRGLLARLEWRGCVEHFECPACGQRENKGGHAPDCWLAAELT